MTDFSLGLFGLGTMGSALALNILEKGYPLAVSNRSPEVAEAFVSEAGPLGAGLTAAKTLAEMARGMPAPRAVILMVPAGQAVDDTIAALLPVLGRGDVIIDGGNADFHDTRRRTKEVEAAGLGYLGMGVSGGEEGARHGPSIMVGGTAEVWDGLRDVIEAIAARFQGAPCAARLGPDGAGHFVKTVHNGIEYADMQLIAEIYALMRGGRGQAPAEIAAVFEQWNQGRLESYLTEITAQVLAAEDDIAGGPAVDAILDSAGQKGTGRWTVIEAVKLGQSASAIEAAVAARAWSSEISAREAGARILGAEPGQLDVSDGQLEAAFLAGRIVAYAQGFRILTAASEAYEWGLDMARTAEIWRAGCIIRSRLLDDISEAFRGDMPQGQLIFAPRFAALLQEARPALRSVVAQAVAGGHPVPALSGALAFLDTMAQARGSANLIQGQRDFFGRHGFTRRDGAKERHGPWWR